MGRDGTDVPQFSLDVGTGADGRTMVTATGELDLAAADEFTSAVGDALAEGDVCIDLAAVTFMDSAGVRALNTALRVASDHGRELRVRDELQSNVVQVLQLTGMFGLLTLEEAGA